MPRGTKKFLKKELLAASLIAFMGMASKKAEAKETAAPEPRVEVSATPTSSYETENTANFYSEQDSPYVYDSRLSRDLSIKYSGAYINPETNEVILKATSRYDKDEYYSSARVCLESQRLRVGPYDCSRDKEIRREQIQTGEYNYANEKKYIYSPSLSRGLSIKYSGAYINPETGEILLKATSRYDDDDHYSSAKNCRESQKLRIGPYDCSKDKEIRREQIHNGEYNKRAVVHDVIRGISEIIRTRRGR